MPVEICAVGGYNEVGRNCTAIKIDDEVIIFDMGIYLESYIRFTEDEDIINLKAEDLIKENAIPNPAPIESWKDKVKAIIPSHAHLDHIGAIPFLSSRFNAPIIATPFTLAVIKAILKDEKMKLPNELITLNAGATFKISENIRVEFIHMTHSTPQTVIVALHTKYGVILYANDFKFDMSPVLEKKANVDRLSELGKKGVFALVCESTYADTAIKMPSESIAREMLRDVLLGIDSRKKGVIVTTFSSHIARLKSIIECGKKMNRKVVFLGRSLAKYAYAAEEVNLVHFSKEVDIIKYSSKIKRAIRKMVKEGKHKYLIVVTGHQGEPKATLAKMVDNTIEFPFSPEDHVVFSCKTIPTPINIENRRIIEQKLKDRHVRIFKDIHVSGHAGREDLRDMLKYVNTKHLIPSHGFEEKRAAFRDLALEMGHDKKNVHLLSNGKSVILD